jgi:chromosomal replication initiation ATPase DnaA
LPAPGRQDPFDEQPLGVSLFLTTKPTFYAYLSRTRAINQKNGVLTVAVPNDRIREWCAMPLLPLIVRSLRDVTGEDLEVEFQVAEASGHVGQ